LRTRLSALIVSVLNEIVLKRESAMRATPSALPGAMVIASAPWIPASPRFSYT
jgi:hypothetical protein